MVGLFFFSISSFSRSAGGCEIYVDGGKVRRFNLLSSWGQRLPGWAAMSL